MTQHLFLLKIENTELDCRIDSNGHPIIRCKSQHQTTVYENLCTLLEENPSLTQEKHLEQFAKLANFFFKGSEFNLIEDPECYKSTYKKTLEEEQDCFELPPFALSRSGEFDVETITPPRLEENALVFYVSDRLPRKVTCDFPIKSESPKVKYELLPHVQ